MSAISRFVRNCMSKLKGKRAVAMVEFVIALPLLIVMIIVLIESGRYFDVYFRMANIAWNGARFFSSLSNPSVACFEENTVDPSTSTKSIYTTNLAFWNGKPSATFPDKLATFDSHLIVHQRIRALFWIANESWPIQSDLLVPDGSNKKLSDIVKGVPSIKTQYIGSLTNSDGSPNTRLTEVCSTPPDVNNANDQNNENTVGVCLEADFVGFFIKIPIVSCAYAFLLVNNESSVIPTNSCSGNGNGNSGGFNFNPPLSANQNLANYYM